MQNGETEDFDSWVRGFEAGINVTLATVMNDSKLGKDGGASKPEGDDALSLAWLEGFEQSLKPPPATAVDEKGTPNAGGLSKAEGTVAAAATSCRRPGPTEAVLMNEKLPNINITTEFEDDHFQVSASKKSDYLAEIGAVADASTGEGGSKAVEQRIAVPACAGERSTGSECALGRFSSQPEANTGVAVQPAGSSMPRRVDGGQAEEEDKAKQLAAATLKLSSLLPVLKKCQRADALHRGFSAIHSVGLEAVVHRALRESEIASGCSLLERLMRRGDARAKRTALRWWNLATAADDPADKRPRADLSAAVRKKNEEALRRKQGLADLAAVFKRKEEGALRRAFTAISNYGLELSVQHQLRDFDLARERRQERQARAFGLLAGVLRRRQNRGLRKALAKWRWSACAYRMEMESGLRLVLRGRLVIAEETARQHRLRSQAHACRLLAGAVDGRRKLQLASALSKWRTAAMGSKVAEREKAVAVRALLRGAERRRKHKAVREAFNQLLLHGAVAIAADNARQRCQEAQTRACHVLAGAVDGRRKLRLASALSKWRTAAMGSKVAEREKAVAVRVLLRGAERRWKQKAVREAFNRILLHGAVAIAADNARQRHQEAQTRACHVLAGAVGVRGKLRLASAVSKWRVVTMVSKVVERKTNAGERKEVRSIVFRTAGTARGSRDEYVVQQPFSVRRRKCCATRHTSLRLLRLDQYGASLSLSNGRGYVRLGASSSSKNHTTQPPHSVRQKRVGATTRRVA